MRCDAENGVRIVMMHCIRWGERRRETGKALAFRGGRMGVREGGREGGRKRCEIKGV